MKKLVLVLMVMLFTLPMVAQDNSTIKAETLEEVLKPYLVKLLDGVEQGITWVSTEVPDVIMQYVVYEAIMAWLGIILGIFMTIFGIWVGKKYIAPDYDGIEWFLYILSPIIGMIFLFENLSTAILATWFPKLFLVKEFITLV